MRSFARTKHGCGCKPPSTYCRRPQTAVSEPAYYRYEMTSIEKSVRIGNAPSFWGDRTDTAAEMLAREPDLNYLSLDYLAEVTMSILAMQRERDPSAGYARDFVEVVRSLVPYWMSGGRCRVVANAGGLNPQGCAEACRAVLAEAGCRALTIGVVIGDDILEL